MDVFWYNNILIYRSVYAPVKSNMYTILSGHEAVVLDPNVDEEILRLFQEKDISRVHILLTHGHYDHISGVEWLQEHTRAEVYCQAKCAERIAEKRDTAPRLVALVLAEKDREDGGHRYQDFKDSFKPVSIIADKTFGIEEQLQIGEFKFRVVSTPGHSPGSACYKLFETMVFTGDTLLQNEPTITRFPESNKADYETIALPYLQSLSKDTIIMPGHGDPFLLSETNNIKLR